MHHFREYYTLLIWDTLYIINIYDIYIFYIYKHLKNIAQTGTYPWSFQRKCWSRGWPPRNGWTSGRSGPSTSTRVLTRRWSTSTGWRAWRTITARAARICADLGTTTLATTAAARPASVSAYPAGKATIATPVSHQLYIWYNIARDIHLSCVSLHDCTRVRQIDLVFS